MSGDPTKVNLWTDADVYVAPLATALPANGSTAFPAGWTLVGLLDGDDGFKTSQDVDTTDHYAWGGVLVATQRKNYKLSKSFSALEDNTTTRSLVWPGSTGTQIIVPKPQPMLFAFETRAGAHVKRLITANHGEASVDGDLTENESDLTKFPIVVAIFPTAGGVLFTVQETP